MNYKQIYNITLKRAKEISKIRLGRYPRPGYSIDIYRYLDCVVGLHGEDITVYRTVQLVNYAGKLQLTSYCSTYNQRSMNYKLGELI